MKSNKLLLEVLQRVFFSLQYFYILELQIPFLVYFSKLEVDCKDIAYRDLNVSLILKLSS